VIRSSSEQYASGAAEGVFQPGYPDVMAEPEMAVGASVDLPIPDAWWRGGVLYQVYPRSFADTDGDGHGDLQGVIDHLDHLEWLGVDGIWLSPITPSPNADWGYDVSDFMSVDPSFGSLDDVDRLVAEASERGIRVVMDLVPNHTSDRHEWFAEARSDRTADRRDWYVWADPGADGSPPNNWRSTFGGPAWTLDRQTGQYYLHNFLASQPDLNWWNDEVRDAFDRILRWWFDRGIDGFRIDVANGLVKDRELRDNPSVTDEDHPRVRSLGLRPVYNMNRDDVHDVYRRWRAIAETYDPPRLLLGETWVLDLDTLMRFFGEGGDELQLVMNFPFFFAELGAELRSVVEATEAALPSGTWPAWSGSNHDVGRFPTRWCRGDARKIRVALLALLTLRGTPLLYYGDEIGMTDVDVPRHRLLDPVGVRGWPDEPGRDGARTPMQWSPAPGGGFTPAGVEPWLPMGDTASCNVADQLDDPTSILHLCRDLIALRRIRPDLRSGSSSAVRSSDETWVWRRGHDTVVAVNDSEVPVDVPLEPGRILIGTDRERDGAEIDGSIRLDPWEAVVVALRREGEPRAHEGAS
jgi:alpha-glucosidase